MRDIKFRAYSKTYNKVLDVISINMNLKTVLLESENKLGRYSLEFEDVDFMQYTGLKDRNGVEIYEEDIIKDRDYMFVAKWNAGGFVLSPLKYSKDAPYIGQQLVQLQTAQYIKESCSVVGNIFENKDLLCSAR